MPAKVRLSITPEGWHYLVMLAIILTGAYLRDVNLLMGLAGMMFGAFLCNVVMAGATLRNLSARRSLPVRAAVGDVVTVDLVMSNHRRRTSAWIVTAQDIVAPEGSAASQARPEVAFGRISPQSHASTSYRCLLTRRGRHRFGPIRLSTRFPLGLAGARSVLPEIDALLVAPRLGQMTGRWRRLMESDQSEAERAGARHGPSEGEFYGLRQWQSGDNLRSIHWRTSAKLGRLAVRQFEQPKAIAAAVVIDLWQPAAPAARDLERVELAVSVAATIVADFCRQGAVHLTVGLAGASPACRRGRASPLFLRETLDWLSEVEASAAADLHGMAERVRRQAASDARLIVVSTRGGEAWQSRRLPLANVVWLEAEAESLSRYYRAEP